MGSPANGLPLLVVEDLSVTVTSGTFLDLQTSLWAGVTIENCTNINVASGATFLDGAASSANFTTGFGKVFVNAFSGAGTFVSGITNQDLRWTFLGNSGNGGTQDTLTQAENYISSSAATTISIAGTAVLIAGTYTSVEDKRFTVSTAGRLTYDGIEDIDVSVTVVLNAEMVSGGSKTCSFYLAKNGSTIASTQMQNDLSNSVTSVTSVQGLVELSTDDYIEVFMANEDDTTNIQVNLMTTIVR